jgi:BirA family biotin operon repressor/biotin-[acetyl-CoA-carboxylase] ligase
LVDVVKVEPMHGREHDEMCERSGMDVAAVTASLSAAARERLEGVEHFATIDSTNRHLLASAPPTPGRLRVALAEHQSAGRGRRGRRWLMPPGSGIALSAAWTFAVAPRELAALSLAAGAAARRAIRDATGIDAGLKWPNDLMLDSGKAGGILVEIAGHASGECHVVVGIGINVSVPAGTLASLSDMPAGARDLAGAARGATIDRALLATALIERLVELFAGFAGSGFAPYRGEWLAAHVLADRRVELQSAQGIRAGIVRGIDSDGALIVEDAAGARQRVLSSDVSVRESV